MVQVQYFLLLEQIFAGVYALPCVRSVGLHVDAEVFAEAFNM